MNFADMETEDMSIAPKVETKLRMTTHVSWFKLSLAMHSAFRNEVTQDS